MAVCVCGMSNLAAAAHSTVSTAGHPSACTSGRCSSCGSAVNFRSAYDHTAKGNSQAQIIRTNSLTVGALRSPPKLRSGSMTSDMSHSDNYEYWGLAMDSSSSDKDSKKGGGLSKKPSLKSLLSVASLFSNMDADFEETISPNMMPYNRIQPALVPIRSREYTSDGSLCPSCRGPASLSMESIADDYLKAIDSDLSFLDLVADRSEEETKPKRSPKITPKSRNRVVQLRSQRNKKGGRSVSKPKPQTRRAQTKRANGIKRPNSNIRSRSCIARKTKNTARTVNRKTKASTKPVRRSRSVKSRSTTRRSPRLNKATSKSKNKRTSKSRSMSKSSRISRACSTLSRRSRSSSKRICKTRSCKISNSKPRSILKKSKSSFCKPCVKYNKPHPNASRKECKPVKKCVSFRLKSLNKRK